MRHSSVILFLLLAHAPWSWGCFLSWSSGSICCLWLMVPCPAYLATLHWYRALEGSYIALSTFALTYEISCGLFSFAIGIFFCIHGVCSMTWSWQIYGSPADIPANHIRWSHTFSIRCRTTLERWVISTSDRVELWVANVYGWITWCNQCVLFCKSNSAKIRILRLT